MGGVFPFIVQGAMLNNTVATLQSIATTYVNWMFLSGIILFVVGVAVIYRAVK